MVYLDGSKYEGKWSNGKADGQGTFTGVNGEKYTGNWVADKKSGKGSPNSR